jgi:hypothetical protein
MIAFISASGSFMIAILLLNYHQTWLVNPIEAALAIFSLATGTGRGAFSPRQLGGQPLSSARKGFQ